MPNVLTLIVVMIVTGVIGGGVSHLLIPVQANGTPTPSGASSGTGQPSGAAGIVAIFRDVELYKSMFIGLAAVFLVPLFFKLINYDIMESVLNVQTLDDKGNKVPVDATKNFNNAMLFISYCLVAAISSKKFIQLITNKTFLSLKEDVEGSKQAVQDLSKRMGAVLDPVTEDEKPTPKPSPQTADGFVGPPPPGMKMMAVRPNPLTTDQNNVLNALASSRYIFRTTEGIAEDCGLDTAKVTEVLSQLIGQELVDQTIQAKGLRFHITAEGKQHCG